MADILKVFIIAGEPSGDKLGASLMNGLKVLTDGQVEFHGVGGDLMQEQGMSSLFDMSYLSIMGLLEVIPSIPMLKKRIKQTTDAAIALKPDVFLTIDSPDFCLRVGKKLREVNPNQLSVHYVAPSVWAWRPKRGAKMAKTVDHVLAILPFEPPYMEREGMTCDFVGHPIAAEKQPNKAEIKSVLADLGMIPSDTIVSILPGSRKSEIKRLLPIYKDAIGGILDARPDTKFVLPAARPVMTEINELLDDCNLPIVILDPTGIEPAKAEFRKQAVYAASQVALATSGTISLDLAKQRCPMVIAYKSNWLSEAIARRIAITDRINLVNIVTDSYIVPELIFEKCTSQDATRAVLEVLNNKDIRNAQIAACEETIKLLGEGQESPGLRAARSVLSATRKRKKKYAMLSVAA